MNQSLILLSEIHTIEKENEPLIEATWHYNYINVPIDFTGVANGCYYVNGDMDTTYTGFASSEAGDWYYVVGGVVSAKTTALVKGKVNGTTTRWKVVGGQVSFTDGLATNVNGTYHVRDGAVDYGFSGFCADDNGNWFYLKKGKVSTGTTYLIKGTVNRTTTWWKVVDGQVNQIFSTVVKIERFYYVFTTFDRQYLPDYALFRCFRLHSWIVCAEQIERQNRAKSPILRHFRKENIDATDIICMPRHIT